MKTFVLTDSTSLNSHGFKIDVLGIDTARFLKNPVMFYNHDREKVVGRWENLRIEGGKLLADAILDENSELGAEVSRQVEEGFLKGCSVGICIKKIQDGDEGAVVLECELIEASIVSVPSDKNAVCLFDESEKPTTLEAVFLKFAETAILGNENSDMGNLSENEKELNTKEFKQQLNSVKMKDENKKNETENLRVVNFDFKEAYEDLLLQFNDLSCEVLELRKKAKRCEELLAEKEAFEALQIKNEIELAISQRKISAAKKEFYQEIGEKLGIETLRAVLEEKKPEVISAPRISELLQKEQAGEFSGTWDELDKAGKLSALKASDPARFEQLFNEKFSKR